MKKNKHIKGFIKVPNRMLKDFSEIERGQLAELKSGVLKQYADKSFSVSLDLSEGEYFDWDDVPLTRGDK